MALQLAAIASLVIGFLVLVGSAAGLFFAEPTPVGDPGMLSVAAVFLLLGAASFLRGADA